MTTANIIACLTAALLLVSWFWRPRPGPERGVLALVAGYAVLGVWSLWFAWYAPDTEPAAFEYWKPTVLFWMLAVITLVSPLLGWGYPAKAIFGTFLAFSNRLWRSINAVSMVVFAVFGTVNLLVALNLSHGNWEGFKYSCRVLLMFIIIFRINFVWLDIVGRIVIHLYGRVKSLRP